MCTAEPAGGVIGPVTPMEMQQQQELQQAYGDMGAGVGLDSGEVDDAQNMPVSALRWIIYLRVCGFQGAGGLRGQPVSLLCVLFSARPQCCCKKSGALPNHAMVWSTLAS